MTLVRRELRLRSNADFQRVRRAGRSVANPLLVLQYVRNPAGQNRFGFAVGKKVGGAVERNLIKRRLREWLRIHYEAGRLQAGIDLVLIARTAASGAESQVLGGALQDLLGRAGLWREGGR